jgi:hypothetical protein
MLATTSRRRASEAAGSGSAAEWGGRPTRGRRHVEVGTDPIPIRRPLPREWDYPFFVRLFGVSID